MNFWTWLDRNGLGVGFVVAFAILAFVLGGLAYTEHLGSRVPTCTIPCDEVHTK